MLDRTLLEEKLAQLPLYEYYFIDTDELVFTERVRTICATECPMYGKSWACRPERVRSRNAKPAAGNTAAPF